jgi:hypothetical protein
MTPSAGAPTTGAPTRVSRWDRGAIIVLGLAAFAQSFDALRQMAGAIHVRAQLTWLFPFLIDGFIAYGIRALLVLRDARLRARVYAWSLVGIATATSVWANSLHAVRLNQQTEPDGLRLDDVAVGVLSMAAPLAIAGAVHLYIVLARDGGTSLKAKRPNVVVPTFANQGPYGRSGQALPDDIVQAQPHHVDGGDHRDDRDGVRSHGDRESAPHTPSLVADSVVESAATESGTDSDSGPGPEPGRRRGHVQDSGADSARIRSRTRSPRMQAAAPSRPGSGRGLLGPHHRPTRDAGARDSTVRESGTRQRTADTALPEGARRPSGRRDSGPPSARSARSPVSEDTLIALARTAPRLPDGRLSRKQISTVIRSHGHRISNDRINGLMAALRDDITPN